MALAECILIQIKLEVLRGTLLPGTGCAYYTCTEQDADYLPSGARCRVHSSACLRGSGSDGTLLDSICTVRILRCVGCLYFGNLLVRVRCRCDMPQENSAGTLLPHRYGFLKVKYLTKKSPKLIEDQLVDGIRTISIIIPGEPFADAPHRPAQNPRFCTARNEGKVIRRRLQELDILATVSTHAYILSSKQANFTWACFRRSASLLKSSWPTQPARTTQWHRSRRRRHASRRALCRVN